MAENAVADGAPTVAPSAGTGAGEGQSAGGSILAELEADTPKAPEASPDPWGDPEFVKRLESLDFSKAPEPIRRKVEAPFVRDWTPKWQSVAKERAELQAQKDKFLDVALERLRSGGVETPTQTVQDQIRERIEAGDLSALPEMMRQEIEREVGPMRQQAALRNALDKAVQISPLVREKEPEIAEIIRGDPQLQQLASMNNYQYAPLVLAALADRIEKVQIQQEFEAYKAQADVKMKAYARRAIEEMRAQGASLPSVSSQAGSGNGASRSTQHMTAKEAILDAFIKAGGVPDPRL
jgi:hypothetical protein